MSEAINIFLNQSICENGIPFKIKRPNSETIEAMQSLKRGEGQEVTLEELVFRWKEIEKENN